MRRPKYIQWTAQYHQSAQWLWLLLHSIIFCRISIQTLEILRPYLLRGISLKKSYKGFQMLCVLWFLIKGNITFPLFHVNIKKGCYSLPTPTPAPPLFRGLRTIITRSNRLFHGALHHFIGILMGEEFQLPSLYFEFLIKKQDCMYTGMFLVIHQYNFQLLLIPELLILWWRR